jgi:hypothetical protein
VTNESSLFEPAEGCSDTPLRDIERLGQFAGTETEVRVISEKFEYATTVRVLVGKVRRVIALEIDRHYDVNLCNAP